MNGSDCPSRLQNRIPSEFAGGTECNLKVVDIFGREFKQELIANDDNAVAIMMMIH